MSNEKEKTLNLIENNFVYHAPLPGQPEIYENIRGTAKNLAKFLVEVCPGSRERSIALTKLEEVMFWACASIARNPDRALAQVEQSAEPAQVEGVTRCGSTN